MNQNKAFSNRENQSIFSSKISKMTTQKLLKPFALAIAVLFLGTTAWSQVGIKAGINLASLSQDPDEENYEDYKSVSILGFQGGLTFELPVAGPLAIQPELLFIQKGGKSEFIINESNKLVTTVTYNYVEVPVLLKLKLGNTDGDGLGFYLLGGPFAGYSLGGKSKQELTILGQTTVSEQDIDYDDEDFEEKRLDWGASFGAGLHFGKLFVDARYNLGVNNLLDDDANNNNDDKPYLRTRGIGLTVGLVL